MHTVVYMIYDNGLHGYVMKSFEITDSPPLSVISPSFEYFQQLVSEQLWFSGQSLTA